MTCDRCIAAALDLSVQLVSRATMALGTTGDFQRRKGECADCGRAKLVIRAAS